MDVKSVALLSAGALVGAGVAYAVMRSTGTAASSTSAGASTIPGTSTAASSLQLSSSAPNNTRMTAPGLASPSSVTVANFTEDEVLSEHLTRNVQFFGQEGQLKIANAYVVVVGLGGVGSHAAHLLLRSGVGKLRLLDFDQVTLSSLNRHAVATREDVGIPKATCLARHFAQIMPEAEVEVCVEMFTAEAQERLLLGGFGGRKPDYVLDAIDNIDTKVALVAACCKWGIPVLAVAGAGAKADPTRLKVVDLSESSVDPLARSLRARLRKEHGVPGGVPVLLSTEKPRCSLVSLADSLAENSGNGGVSQNGSSTNLLDYQIVPNFRVRTIPVLGTSPAIFGMAAAAHILCCLAEQPWQSEPIIQLTGPQYQRALTRLQQREEERFGTSDGVAVDYDDMVYLLREVWRGLSARDEARIITPGGDKGLMRSTAHLAFTRWDASQTCTADNLVLLTQEEADAHDAATLQEVKANDPKFYARVCAVLDRVRRELYY